MARHVVPYDSRDIERSASPRMPAGMPFGVALFGAAYFRVLKIMLEHAERAVLADTAYRAAVAGNIDARAEVDRALLRRRQAQEELHNYESIRMIARMKIDLERLEMEERLDAKITAMEGGEGRRQDVNRLLHDLTRLPEIARAAASARAQIMEEARAGGMDEGGEQLAEFVDTLVSAFASAQTEARAL